MKPQLTQLTTDALQLLAPVVLALIGWLGLRLQKLIATKVENEKIEGVLLRLEAVVETAVKETAQTFLSNLKSPTPKDYKKARAMALESIKAYVGPRGIEEAKKVLGLQEDGALEKLIASLLEATVHDLKTAAKSGGPL